MTLPSPTTDLSPALSVDGVAVQQRQRAFTATAEQLASRENSPSDDVEINHGHLSGATSSKDLSLLLSRLLCNTIATFILVIAVGLSVLATLPVLGGYRSVVVSSGSMEPAIHTADVVVTGSPDTNAIQVGTVVDYRTGDSSRIHRVIEITGAGYVTQGDANPTPDSEVPTISDVLGIGIYVVPFIGLPPIWVDTQAWHKLLLTIFVLGASAFFAREDWLFPPSRIVTGSSVPTRRVNRTFAR